MAVLVQLLGFAAVCSIVLAGVTVPSAIPLKANATKFFAGQLRAHGLLAGLTNTEQTATAPTTTPSITASNTKASTTKASSTTASITFETPTAAASATEASATSATTIAASTSTLSKSAAPKSAVPTTVPSASTPTTTFSSTSAPKTYFSTTSETKPSASMSVLETSSPHVSYIRDIDHQIKLAAQFLKAAAQLSAGLSAEDKAKFDNYGLAEVIHEILESAQSMGQQPASSAESWSLRGGNHHNHHQKRKVCTVTSGYWDKSCECEFIAEEDKKYQSRLVHPHWRPYSVSENNESGEWWDDFINDSSRSTITQPTVTKETNPKPFRSRPRPSGVEYPRPDSWVKPLGESTPTTSQTHAHARYRKLRKMVWDLSRYLSELKDLLIDLEKHPHYSFSQMRKMQRRVMLSAPLLLVDRLQSILESEEIIAKLKSSDELAVKRFLESNVGDIEAMVIYPKYMIDMLGKEDAEQPMAIKLQSFIDKLESLDR